MSKVDAAIRVTSALVLLAAAWAAFATKLFPLLALFAADGAASQSPILVAVKALAIGSLPFLAIASAMLAFANLFAGSSRTLLIAILLIAPALGGAALVHGIGFPSFCKAEMRCTTTDPAFWKFRPVSQSSLTWRTTFR